MQYLIRLVTPKNGTILDPFMGSGSTGKAVVFENKERDVNYQLFLNEDIQINSFPYSKKTFTELIKWAAGYNIESYNNENNVAEGDIIIHKQSSLW